MLSADQRRPTGAGRAALDAYRGAPLSTRVHATVRWWSAPFPAVESALPKSGAVLEIGCGHGLFSCYAALASPSRSVVGVDIDAAKIAQAREVAHRLGATDLRFEPAQSGVVPAGPWNAIVVVDILYLLPAVEQRSLLDAAADQLAPGGALLIKEMSPTPRWKARWNSLQETLAVSILGITERADSDALSGPPSAGDQTSPGQRSSRFDFVSPDAMAGWLEQAGLSMSSTRLDRHRLHPHHLLVGHRAAPSR